jgi:hypothetical protein
MLRRVLVGAKEEDEKKEELSWQSQQWSLNQGKHRMDWDRVEKQNGRKVDSRRVKGHVYLCTGLLIQTSGVAKKVASYSMMHDSLLSYAVRSYPLLLRKGEEVHAWKGKEKNETRGLPCTLKAAKAVHSLRCGLFWGYPCALFGYTREVVVVELSL